MNLQLFCYTMDEPLDGLLTTREPLAMRSGAGRDPGSCTICELSENLVAGQSKCNYGQVKCTVV